MSNKIQILKSLIGYIPQLVKLLYVIGSMYFTLSLIELEADKRVHAIEIFHLLIGGVFTISSIKELFLNDNSVDDIGNE